MPNKITISGLEEQIKEIIGAVFKLKRENIGMDTSRSTIELWDSLNQLRLIAALEDKFNIEFKDEDVLRLDSYQLIRETILDMLEV